jgi:A1 cistron-splicing factor AAR2
MDTTPTPTLLLLDLPPKSLAGIDLLSFTTAPKFKGLKNLPSGWHFAFVSPNTSFSLRHGLWFRVSPDSAEGSSAPPQLTIAKWNPATESLVPETMSTELMRHRANLSAIWREGLSPYRQSAGMEGDERAEEDRLSEWVDLTSHLSPTLMERILGPPITEECWVISSAHSAKGDVDDLENFLHKNTATGSTNAENTRITELDERPLHFSPVNLKQTWREGATGRERTVAARDRSWALNELISQHCGGDANAILGELQLCFLMMLTLNNYSCLEQWKRILELLFTCREAPARDENEVTVGEEPQGRARLFVEVLRLIRLQLGRAQDVAEGGLFDLSEDGASFLTTHLRKFGKDLEETEGTGKKRVLTELKVFEEWAEREFDWRIREDIVKRGMVDLEDGERVEVRLDGFDEEDEEGDFAPTVVELTEDQMRMIQGGQDPRQEDMKMDEDDEDDLDAMDARF